MERRHVMSLTLLAGMLLPSLAFAVKVPPVGPPAPDPPSICDNLAGNLVVNCGFETGTIAGWTLANGDPFQGVDALNPNSGQFAYFDGKQGSDDDFSQNIPTVPGQTYTISFYLLSGGGAPADFSAFFNGALLYSEVNPLPHGFELHTFTAVATGTSTQLLFHFRNDPNYWYFDDVAVVPVDSYLLRYFSNLGAGQSVIDVTNAGTKEGANAPLPDYICANVYTFAEDQQLISCCTCNLSPNDLQTLSVQNDLINNTLTPGVPIGVTVALVATDNGTGTGACNAAVINPLTEAGGMRAWGTTLHAAPGGGFAVTETKFSQANLSAQELAKMTSYCGFILANGSHFGICNSCTQGAAGAAKQ